MLVVIVLYALALSIDAPSSVAQDRSSAEPRNALTTCTLVPASAWNKLVRKERRLVRKQHRFDSSGERLRKRPVCLRDYRKLKRHVARVHTAATGEWLASFKPAIASWYGKPFYGRRTACGQTYSSTIIGVAHKTLACGTIVYFRNGNRAIPAPVIDRGPYVAGRTWDLSAALKRSFSFDGVGTVWTTTTSPPR